jgi:hypothetical protein
MFNCRDLDGGLRVLIKDYSIRCSTSQHDAFELIASAYVLCVSLGITLYVSFSFHTFTNACCLSAPTYRPTNDYPL